VRYPPWPFLENPTTEERNCAGLIERLRRGLAVLAPPPPLDTPALLDWLRGLSADPDAPMPRDLMTLYPTTLSVLFGRVQEAVDANDARRTGLWAFWLGLIAGEGGQLHRWRPFVTKARDRASKDRAAARKGSRVRWHDHETTTRKWLDLDASLQKSEPLLNRKERAARVADRFHTDWSRVYRYLERNDPSRKRRARPKKNPR